MARTHFGTDGVRGIVGETLTLDLVEQLGRAATTWAGRGRVFVGRDTRGSGPALEEAVVRGDRLGRRDRGRRRRAADAGRRAAGPGSRRRPLRLPQPARVQRRQALRRGGPQALRSRTRRRSRPCSRRRRPTASARSSTAEDAVAGYVEHILEHFGCRARRPADRGRLRQRRVLGDRARRVRAARCAGDDGRRGA